MLFRSCLPSATGLRACKARMMVFLPWSSAGLAGFLDAKVNQHLVIGDGTEALDAGIMQPDAIHVVTNLVQVWGLRELDIDQRAAAELYAQRDVVPEQHGTDSGDAKHQ